MTCPRKKNAAQGRGRRPAGAAITLGLFVLGSGAGAVALDASSAQATAATQSYEIPPGPVATALNRFAEKSGTILVYDSALALNKTTAGLRGAHTLNEALSQLLSGTGLAYRLAPSRKAVAIMLAQNDAGTQSDVGAVALPAIDVAGAAGPGGGGGSSGGDPTGTGPGESGNRFTGYNTVNATAALKDNVPILQTPVAVQVVPRETLDDQQDISIQQALVGNVSSVYQAASPNVTSFLIRGFFDTRSQIYYNGLSLANVVNLDTANVQNFQVLKGPAAILYGRVEPGGIIYLETKLPQEIPYFSFQQQAGAFGLTRTTVDATGPLTADKTWLYRLNIDVGDANSFVDFVSTRNLFIAPALTYHPIEQFTLHLNGFYQRNKNIDNTFGDVALGNRPAPLPVSRYLEDPSLTQVNPTFNQTELFNYDWTYNINPNWSVTNRFLLSAQSEFVSQSGPYALDQFGNASLIDEFASSVTYNVRSNLDLKGKFDTGPVQHAVLIGTDYLFTDGPVSPATLYFPTTPLNIFNPIYFQTGFSFQIQIIFSSFLPQPMI